MIVMRPVFARTLALPLLGVALSVASAPAWAADPSGEPTAAEIAVARKAFADATALEKAEKWAEAEAKLAEAASIKETPGLRYHLGFCMEQQGKLVAALVEYDRASELLSRGAKAPDVAELVGPAGARVRAKVAQVTVKLSGAPADAKVELDGAQVKPALFGKAMPANPGKHVVTASAPGHQAFRRELMLNEAQSEQVVIDLTPITGAPAAGGAKSGSSGAGSGPDGAAGDGSMSADSASGSGSARTYVLIGEAAVTAIMLGVGIFYTIDKGNAQEQVDDANAFINKDKARCASAEKPIQDACDQLPGLVDQRDRAATLATVGFIGAGVGAVATVTTFLLWKPAKRKDSALWIAPVVPVLSGTESRGTGIAVGGRF